MSNPHARAHPARIHGLVLRRTALDAQEDELLDALVRRHAPDLRKSDMLDLTTAQAFRLDNLLAIVEGHTTEYLF